MLVYLLLGCNNSVLAVPGVTYAYHLSLYFFPFSPKEQLLLRLPSSLSPLPAHLPAFILSPIALPVPSFLSFLCLERCYWLGRLSLALTSLALLCPQVFLPSPLSLPATAPAIPSFIPPNPKWYVNSGKHT